MNNRLQSHFFWGSHAPLSTLSCAALIILASARLAYAILCAGAILWVYGLTALVFFSSRPLMPQKGKFFVLLFLSVFFSSLYILLAGLINPLLISATWFFLIIIPPCCTGSGLFEGMENSETGEILSRVCQEAFCLALIIIAFSLIREPLGLGTLSFPGGIWGIFEFFEDTKDGDGFFPIQLLSVSSGGFLLLGIGAAIFRYLRGMQSESGDES